MKNFLVKVNFGKLVENQLKKVQTTKLERISRCKPKNKVVYKEEIIIVEKA